MSDIRLVEINHTAYEEENVMLVTDLTDDQIKAVIEPIVLKERNSTEETEEECYYDNDTLCDALRETYPTNVIIDYGTDTFDKIKI